MLRSNITHYRKIPPIGGILESSPELVKYATKLLYIPGAWKNIAKRMP
jgi:hypothetical protein